MSSLLNPGSTYPWKYCRMCAFEVTQGVSIFGEEGRRLQIAEKIRSTIGILVMTEDALPKKVCTNCCNLLNACSNYKSSVLYAQGKLKVIAQSFAKEQKLVKGLMQLRNQNRQSYEHPKPSKRMQRSSLDSTFSSLSSFRVPFSVSSAPEKRATSVQGLASEMDESTHSQQSVSSSEGESTSQISTCEVRGNGAKNVNVGPSHLSENIRSIPKAIPHTSESTNQSDGNVPQLPSPSEVPSRSGSVSAVANGQSVTAKLMCRLCKSSFKDKISFVTHFNSIHHNQNRQKQSETCQPTGNGDQQASSNSVIEANRQRRFFDNSTALDMTIERAQDTGENQVLPQITEHPQGDTNVGEEKGVEMAGESVLNTNSISEIRNHGTYGGTGVQNRVNGASTSRATSSSVLEDVPERDSWKCDICSKILLSKSGYAHHAALHKAQRFECTLCEAKYTQKKNLELHMQTHHANPNDEINCHNRTPTQSVPMTCVHCQKTFKSMAGLKVHMKVHQQSKRLPCLQCTESFATRKELEEHRSTHIDSVKLFKCSVENCTHEFSCFNDYAQHFKEFHLSKAPPANKASQRESLQQRQMQGQRGSVSVTHNSGVMSVSPQKTTTVSTTQPSTTFNRPQSQVFPLETRPSLPPALNSSSQSQTTTQVVPGTPLVELLSILRPAAFQLPPQNSYNGTCNIRQPPQSTYVNPNIPVNVSVSQPQAVYEQLVREHNNGTQMISQSNKNQRNGKAIHSHSESQNQTDNVSERVVPTPYQSGKYGLSTNNRNGAPSSSLAGVPTSSVNATSQATPSTSRIRPPNTPSFGTLLHRGAMENYNNAGSSNNSSGQTHFTGVGGSNNVGSSAMINLNVPCPIKPRDGTYHEESVMNGYSDVSQSPPLIDLTMPENDDQSHNFTEDLSSERALMNPSFTPVTYFPTNSQNLASGHPATLPSSTSVSGQHQHFQSQQTGDTNAAIAIPLEALMQTENGILLYIQDEN